jgi:hypothetical protein
MGREAALYGAVLIPDKPAIDRLVKAFLNGDPAPGSASPTPAGG